ncbi:MAG: DUF362 domain-containing protein [Eubacteriales bacterium]|nr:DUF362 domain-containing protein [Eubacteriales bacterium]
MELSEYCRVEEWPRLIRVNQKFSAPEVIEIENNIKEQFECLGKLKVNGKSIAIAVGSRGIQNLDIIVRAVVDNLKRLGAKPFIVPAMGSHGGATPDGQTEVLDFLGISEQTVGAPIVSDLDVEIIGYIQDSIPVYYSRTALQSDGVVVINRIKMHTSFRGNYESGLLKMMVVGLGKHMGASIFHYMGFENMAENLIELAKVVFLQGNVICGVGIVENANEKIAKIAVIPIDSIQEEEPKLLNLSKSLMPRIPFEKLDILVVERIGKNISGDGMDPNITGRYTPDLKPDYNSIPRIKRIVALDLTDESHGSAIGMGHVDVITRRFYTKIDFQITYINSITATVTNTCKMPIVMPDEKSALEVAFRTTQVMKPNDIKLCIIKDTLHLESMVVSEALFHKECVGYKIEYGKNFYSLRFDEKNNLIY